MASVTTKFSIGDTFYTFDPIPGTIKVHVVIGVGISGVGGLSTTPYINYTAVNCNQQFAEVDCLNATEVTDIGNAWLANKSITMFANVIVGP